MIQADNKLHLTHKQPNDITPFLLKIGSPRNLTNPITGDAAIPLIGKYSRNQYHFLKIDALIELDLHDIDNQFTTLAQGDCQAQQISLPDSVLNILNNIPEQIEHNKPPPKQKHTQSQSKKNKKKQDKKQTKQQFNKIDQYLNKKQDNYQDQEGKIQEQQIQEEQPQQQHYEQQQQFQGIQQELEQEPQLQKKEKEEIIPPFHPMKFEKSKRLRFTWTISSLMNRKILEPLKQEPCLSYVNHNWIFEEINFEFQKKLIQLIPICLVDPMNVIEYGDGFKSIKFNELRSEYMSVHLGPQGSLCFSPNNMKIMVNLKDQLVSFWIIILGEDGTHYIYYHWIILSDILSEMSQTIGRECKCLGNLVDAYQDLGDDFKKQCDIVRKVYNF